MTRGLIFLRPPRTLIHNSSKTRLHIGVMRKSVWNSGDADANPGGLVHAAEDWVHPGRGLGREELGPLPRKKEFSLEMACFGESPTTDSADLFPVPHMTYAHDRRSQDF